MDDLSSMTLAKFRLWSLHALKVYLSCRNRSVNGEFDELAARAFCVWEENLPVNESAELAEKRLLAEYKQKLVLDGDVIPDPFSLSTGWKGEKEGITKWPSVYITDVSTYLGCSTTSEVINKLLNEYKLGKAYRYFDSQWVKEVFYHEIRDNSNKCFLKTQVTPSQAVNNKCYDVWVVVKKDSIDGPGGEILSAYCTCTAGMFGSCNHVAGLLFRIEKAVKFGNTKISSTSKLSKWNVPRKKICVSRPGKSSSEMWNKARYNRSEKSKSDQLKNKQLKVKFTPMSKQQMEEVQDLVKVRSDVHCLLQDDINDSCFSLMIEKRRFKPPPKPDLPPSVIDAVKDMSPTSSMADINERLRITNIERDTLRKETTQQSLCSTWKEQRKGRITASVFQRVSSRVNTLRKNDSDPSALIETIVGRKEIKQTVAMKHGLALEPLAKTEYSNIMKKKHKKFQCCDSGLTVDLTHPYLAASADLEIECSCCGKGLCEIKCPETIKDQVPSLQNVKYLKEVDGAVCLDSCHSYFFQIQGQMKVLERSFCDLFIFTLHGHLCIRVSFNEEFWKTLEEKLVWFWGQHVLPALLQNDNDQNKENDHAQEQHLTHASTPAKQSTSTKTAVCRVLLPTSSQKSKTQQPRKKRKTLSKTPVYLCGTCGCDCVDNPQSDEEQSINCDKCGMWIHFVCAGINESLLNDEDKWFCVKCK